MQFNNKMLYIKRFVSFINKPLVHDMPFFLNVLLLLIVPTILNAYVINTDEYISLSSKWTFGFLVKYGASFPYILFIPYVITYFLSLLLYLLYNRIIRKIYKTVIYGLLLMFFVVNIFLLCNFRTMLSPSIVLLINETNSGEIQDFVDSYFIDIHSIYSYLISFLMVLFVLIIEKSSNRLNNIFKRKMVLFFVPLFTLYMFYRSINPFQQFFKMYSCDNLDSLEFWYLDYRPDTNMFTNVLYSYYTHIISRKELLRSRESTLSLRKGNFTNSNSTIVFVIGESYNKHHSELYGYLRHTNPHLKAELDKGNLFVFSDVVTPYNMTSYVMKNLFSVNSLMNKEKWGEFPIFPAVFKDSGFSVYFWDNQKTAGKADVSDYSIYSYLYDPDVVRYAYSECNSETFEFDLDLMKNFFSYRRIEEGRSLVIIHLRGQHDMAENRYPHTPKYMYFTQDSILGNYSDKQRNQIAYYDNATRYNDEVMSYLISQVREQESVIVYLSDHGEEVHDYRDHYGRTQENVKTKGILRFQYEVPFLIWCSDRYKEKYPEKIMAIRKALNKPFMIDNTCHVLFNLSNVQTHYYSAQRDLISPLYKPYHYRVIQNNVVYEDLMSD